MFTILAGAILAATPVNIEVLGFTVETRGSEVVVTAVQPETVAASASMTVGTVLEKLIFPKWPFVTGPLDELTEIDLHDALTPPHGQPLVLRVRFEGKTRTVTLTRADPPPADPFPGMPWPPEKLKRLTLPQRADYYSRLPAAMKALRPAATGEAAGPPALELGGTPTVTVGPAGITGAKGAAWSPGWVYSTGRLEIRCKPGEHRLVELTSVAPVPAILANEARPPRESAIDVELALWRNADVLEACRAGQTSLPSTRLSAALRCGEGPPRTTELSASLRLICDPSARPSPARLDGLRVSPQRLKAGGNDELTVTLDWAAFRPTPLSVGVVLADNEGNVRRLATAPPLERQTAITLHLDLSVPGTFTLVPEAKFFDGSFERGPGQPLRIDAR